MKHLHHRISALLLALMLLSLPLAAQAVSLLDLSDYLSNEAPASHPGSLIDTSDDEDEDDRPDSIGTPTVTAAPAPVTLPNASADTSRIRDDANLFSSQEETQLAQRIAQFQQNTGMDFVIMTSDRPHEGLSAQQLADDYYDYGGFGLDEENSGVAYYIDMNERYHYLSTTGAMIDYMTDDRIDSVINRTGRYLSSGQYAEAAQNMIDLVEGYYRQGIPEGQYQYDVVTGQVLPARHKALTSGEILFSGIIALVVAFIFYKSVHSTYSLKGNTYSYSPSENSQLRMTDTEDTYTHTTTTRVRKPDPPRTGGGGFGGGGGSGVHVGSSGASHGGGGGRF